MKIGKEDKAIPYSVTSDRKNVTENLSEKSDRFVVTFSQNQSETTEFGKVVQLIGATEAPYRGGVDLTLLARK